MTKCLFCGKEIGERDYLYLSCDGTNGICDDCIKKAGRILEKAEKETQKSYLGEDSFDGNWIYADADEIFDDDDLDFENCDKEYANEIQICYTKENTSVIGMLPNEIKQVLDQEIIGQEQAKKTLAVCVYNHFKRINDKTGKIKKSNVLIVGPSGTGKTLLAQTLAKVLDVPFAIADATSLTEAGYVGDDVETILSRLLSAADYNVSRAERGIIYIDEIDKLARKGGKNSGTRDVSGEGVQHALLKIIEGAEVSVPVVSEHKSMLKESVILNTKNILFICGGAFEGLLGKTEISEQKMIGFHSRTQETLSEPCEKEKSSVTPDRLVEYGMIPELIGRLPIIVTLDSLQEDQLVRILTEPESSLIKEYQELVKADGVELEFEPEALQEIANIAMQRHTGARGLRSILEELMMEIMYQLPTLKGQVKRCVITKDTIHHHKPKLVYHAA